MANDRQQLPHKNEGKEKQEPSKQGSCSIDGEGGIQTHVPLRTTAFRVFKDTAYTNELPTFTGN